MIRARGTRVLASLIGIILSACGAGDSSASQPDAATQPVSQAAAQPASSADPSAGGGQTFSVASGSTATVSVREQLARLPAPSDAVLRTNSVTGTFTVRPDGSFASASKITVDLRTLTSDQSQRDRFIMMNPLETSRYPTAEFVPTRAIGLTFPLPTTSDETFQLTGTMTIHGTSKSVTFDVVARSTGTGVRATATANPTFKFEDFGMKPPSAAVVLSVVDEVKLQMDITASQQ
ncbi:MAG: YceI family protein [Chloroflexota bacterium]|nr:YceI family protein [Chloroflexota bacterium]